MELWAPTAYADWFEGMQRRTASHAPDTVRFIRIACSTFFHTCGTARWAMAICRCR